MTNKGFISTFFITIVGVIACYLAFICFIDPQKTAPIALSKSFTPYHDNFLLRKAELMENSDFETVILGSSTSEAYSVQDIDHLFKTSSFHASIGGGNTASRYVLFKKAIKNFSNFKRVIYVADLYEFNQPRPVQVLSFNKYLAEELSDKNLLLPKYDYLKYLFSHQLIESAFSVMKRERMNYKSPLLKDGTTTTSMILSKVQTDADFLGKVKAEDRQKLREEILENNGTYSRSVLANFKELNPDVKNLFSTMAAEAKSKNVELVFILSPYQAEFRKLLFKNPDVEQRYKDWIEFFQQLEKESGARVYNPLESVIATDPDSGVWRDGIHYNSHAAAYFLKIIAEGK